MDPFLAEQLNKKNTQKKEDIFDQEIDKILENYFENEDSDASEDQLLSKSAMISHKVNAFKESIRMDEYQENLMNAIVCIHSFGSQSLEPEVWKRLSEELNKAAEVVKKLTPQTDLSETPYQFFGISENSLEAINTICRERYKEKDIDAVISLCTLLTTFAPLNAFYWLQLGVGFHEKGKHQKALTSYAISRHLNPKQIECWIFSAECYLSMELVDDAIIELEFAKDLVDVATESNHDWLNIVEQLEIQTKKAA